MFQGKIVDSTVEASEAQLGDIEVAVMAFISSMGLRMSFAPDLFISLTTGTVKRQFRVQSVLLGRGGRHFVILETIYRTGPATNHHFAYCAFRDGGYRWHVSPFMASYPEAITGDDEAVDQIAALHQELIAKSREWATQLKNLE